MFVHSIYFISPLVCPRRLNLSLEFMTTTREFSKKK